MKTLLAILLIAVLAFILGNFLPWWSIAIAAFVISVFIKQQPFAAFLAGLLGIGLLWAIQAYLIDVANDSILSRKVASLLPLQGSPALLISFTALLGGIIGGLAALSGNFLSGPKRSPADRENYYRSKLR